MTGDREVGAAARGVSCRVCVNIIEESTKLQTTEIAHAEGWIWHPGTGGGKLATYCFPPVEMLVQIFLPARMYSTNCTKEPKAGRKLKTSFGGA